MSSEQMMGSLCRRDDSSEEKGRNFLNLDVVFPTLGNNYSSTINIDKKFKHIPGGLRRSTIIKSTFGRNKLHGSGILTVKEQFNQTLTDS